MQSDTAKPWTWRVEHIPRGTTQEQLKLFFVEADRSHIEVESLVPEYTVPDLFYHQVADYDLTATISFRAQEGRRPQLVDEHDGKIDLDADFYGFTSLHSPEKESIAADVIAVTGLAGHAFGSWMHARSRSHTRMWLRDYLPKKISNIRVLLYGYPSKLQNLVSTISLFEHSNNLKERLLAMRHAAQCRNRPIIFIGHSLGCLIVKRVVVDINRISGLLLVRSFIFLGAPHRGLEITALHTLVQGTSSESVISELKEGSSVLEILDQDFEKYFRGSPVHILTCYESYATPTVMMSSDGTWKRDGAPVMMVTKARAHLGYEYSEIGVYSDHSNIAKIDLSSEGPFLSIIYAIHRVLSDDSEQRGSPETLGLHPSSDADLSHSFSAAATLGRSKRSTTGLSPEIAEQPSPTTILALGRSRGLNSSSDANLPHSFSAATTLGLRKKSTAELLPATAAQPSPTAILALGRSRSHSATPEKSGTKTETAAKSSHRPANRVGEDLPTENPPINRAIYEGKTTQVRDLSIGGHIDKQDSDFYNSLMVPEAADQKQIVDHLMARGLNGDTGFHIACERAGVGIVSMFLGYKELLESRGAEGRTPLMSSMQNSRAEVAKLLLDATVDVEASDQDGKTALHYASMMGKDEIVRLLIEDRKANMEKTTKFGWTPLHCAAHNRHPRIIELLGKNGADCKAVTSKEDGARTAIHLILLSPGRTRCISRLLAHGASLEQPDGAGNTPLHWATQYGAPNSVEWLISKKADLESRTNDWSKMTPLHIAALNGRLEIARVLLDAGANKEATMVFPYGKNALHIATEANYTDLVKELIDRKAWVDPVYNTQGVSKPPYTNPLIEATENGNLEIMDMLLKSGADVDGKYMNLKCRPLSSAVKQGNLEAVRKLLDYNADPGTEGFAAPFVEATEAGNIPIMKELLAQELKPDVESLNDKGYRCLSIAASLGHVDAVKLLLDHGANPSRGVSLWLHGSRRSMMPGEYFESDVSEADKREIVKMLCDHM